MQIIRQSDVTLPCLRILDEPDFPVRGVMLDISRNKMPTITTLYRLMEDFERVRQYVTGLAEQLDRVEMKCDDAKIIKWSISKRQD